MPRVRVWWSLDKAIISRVYWNTQPKSQTLIRRCPSIRNEKSYILHRLRFKHVVHVRWAKQESPDQLFFKPAWKTLIIFYLVRAPSTRSMSVPCHYLQMVCYKVLFELLSYPHYIYIRLRSTFRQLAQRHPSGKLFLLARTLLEQQRNKITCNETTILRWWRHPFGPSWLCSTFTKILGFTELRLATGRTVKITSSCDASSRIRRIRRTVRYAVTCIAWSQLIGVARSWPVQHGLLHHVILVHNCTRTGLFSKNIAL